MAVSLVSSTLTWPVSAAGGRAPDSPGPGMTETQPPVPDPKLLSPSLQPSWVSVVQPTVYAEQRLLFSSLPCQKAIVQPEVPKTR